MGEYHFILTYRVDICQATLQPFERPNAVFSSVRGGIERFWGQISQKVPQIHDVFAELFVRCVKNKFGHTECSRHTATCRNARTGTPEAKMVGILTFADMHVMFRRKEIDANA